jgi:ribosomal-protein-alanine N-acetyltransferase
MDIYWSKFFGNHMKIIVLRSLAVEDARELLRFEEVNRAWFERHIDPRPDEFYSIHGVTAHIQELLTSYAKGQFHAFILIDETGAIVGRANLKEIRQDAGIAEIGYRIAENSVGKGLATQALTRLIEVARKTWKLKRLIAFVTDDNKASARVLEKQGFVLTDCIQDLALVSGKSLNGCQFSLDL